MEGSRDREKKKQKQSAVPDTGPGTGPIDVTFESCVLCHKRTDVPRGTPIEKRRHYIEGAGQLCGACWQKTYGKEK